MIKACTVALCLVFSAAKQQPRSLRGLTVADASQLESNTTMQWSSFEQQSDHFTDDSKTWNQRYWFDDSLFNESDTTQPIYLIILGESYEGLANPATADSAKALADETGGLIVALQHRFYGCYESDYCIYESGKFTTDDLRLLTSQQAIEDIAQFHAFLTGQYALAPTNQFVTLGCSYPGALAAWTRAKHPELISAAVACSAPVKVTADFWQYSAHAATAYSEEAAGGSAACVAALEAGFQQLHAASPSAVFGELAGGCTGEQAVDVVWRAVLNQDADGPFVQGVCNAMLEDEDALAGMGRLAERFDLVLTGEQCADSATGKSQLNDMETYVQGANENGEAGSFAENEWVEGPADMFWWWQVCNEFGYHQTCGNGGEEGEGGRCMVAGLLDRSYADFGAYVARRCKGFPGYEFVGAEYGTAPGAADADAGVEQQAAAKARAVVAATLAHYGDGDALLGPEGSSGGVTRIYWSNGSLDPWSALSVVEPRPGIEQPAAVVEAQGHCSWDGVNAGAARGDATSTVALWLQQGSGNDDGDEEEAARDKNEGNDEEQEESAQDENEGNDMEQEQGQEQPAQDESDENDEEQEEPTQDENEERDEGEGASKGALRGHHRNRMLRGSKK